LVLFINIWHISLFSVFFFQILSGGVRGRGTRCLACPPPTCCFSSRWYIYAGLHEMGMWSCMVNRYGFGKMRSWPMAVNS